jgi:DNA-directed RNA polymerase specialized sigma24 family protein
VLLALTHPGDEPARAAQFNDQVEHLCAGFSAGERRFLEMSLQGYSRSEIAAELRLTPVALRVRLSRLRQRLRANGVLDDWI